MTEFFMNLIEASKREDFAEIISEWMESGLFESELPEVHSMTGCDQPEKWHPEGSVWEHVLAGIRNADLSEFDIEDHWVIRLSIFFHDIGKPAAFKRDEAGNARYFRHDYLGIRVFKQICTRHDVTDLEFIEAILFSTQHHMKLHLFGEMRKKKIEALVSHKRWPLLKATGKADIYSRQFDTKGNASNINCDEEYAMLQVYPHKK